MEVKAKHYTREQINEVVRLLKEAEGIVDKIEWFDKERPNFITGEWRLHSAVKDALKWANTMSLVGDIIEK